MNKCEKCSKNITKSKPGLECGRCEKIVHLNTQCSGLTAKQQAALRATDNLEWNCQECRDTSIRHNSIVFPNDEDEDDVLSNVTLTGQPEIKKLLEDISKDLSTKVEKSVRREMKSIDQAIQFNSNKLDDVLKKFEVCLESISELKKKNIELTNKNTHLETRVGALEQRIHEIEQRKLSKHIEVFNVPFNEPEDPLKLAGKVATILQQKSEDIKEAKRMPGRKDRTAPIQVKLRSETTQMQWLSAAKSKPDKILVSDVISSASGATAQVPVYIKEALTPYNKQLLWSAKQELQEKYKFIWCKKGVLRVRKEGSEEKPYIIRSMDDITALKKKNK
ncbi:hypothetical protein NE865_09417 [Phthorimaea operculella]|nr:hypothetical protein NE865_13556 [Phthorimaea operculella]KAI5637902.1 hypothetical protein NE865_09417 [Phthorimaea operculella]